MQYKGHELIEIKVDKAKFFKHPHEMLCWTDEYSCHPVREFVIAIVPRSDDVLFITDHSVWHHGAEITEEPKPRRATMRELAKWLAQGNGQIQDANSLNCVFTGLDYGPDLDDRAAPEIYKVRKWDDTEWHEPTAEYMELEA